MCACGRVDNTFVAALHTYGFDGCIQFYVEWCHEVGFGLDEQAVARAAKGYALLHCILQFALTLEHNVLRKVLLPLEEVGKDIKCLSTAWLSKHHHYDYWLFPKQ